MPKKYLALIRGINVGGNNIIKMTALKTCFEELGFLNVATYIQSGNVVFTSPEKDVNALCEKIEDAIAKKFGCKTWVILVTDMHLKNIVEEAPKDFGKDPSTYRYDVMFLKNPLTAKQAIKDIPLKEGVDTVYVGKGVIYFSRLIRKATQSRLSKIIGLPIYKQMTIRNWNTTTKLIELIRKNLK